MNIFFAILIYMIYVFISLNIILLIVLFIVLNRLYQLKLSSSKSHKKLDYENLKKIWNKIDELLVDMISIHNYGMSGVSIGKERDFYQMALDRACDIVESKRGSIMLFDEKQQCLVIVASKNIRQELVENIKLKPGEGVAGRAFEKSEIIFVTVPEKNPNYEKFMGYEEQKEPFISLPLKSRERVLGVLNIHLPENKTSFSEWDLKFLNIIADEISVMIENIFLYQSIEKFYLELVETLVRIIDAKDSYTGDHASRARERAVKLAKKLNVPQQMIKSIEYAALLHDMGKIGVNEKILTKPGKLTDEEYREMKKHPEIAYQILSPIEFLNPVAKMIRYHHEWYNGMGYPEGLKGEEIPLGSRIVSVIDAWDAMTSDRPYRKALSKEQAIEELKKGSGKQFDPKVVSAFLELLEEENLSR
ncbi:MAG: HD domain-containing protein [Elusimicrobiales bacterium]|nr:HD domain-containing protein [Elusimicrobiales bacterium]